MILILGKGDLATAIHQQLPDAVCVGRPEYDFKCKNDCDKLLDDYTPTVVINTVAVNEHHNVWDILTVNYTSVAYLTVGFYERMPTGHIINISSATTMWVSYPGINNGRLAYNISKESLSNFGRHFTRKTVDDTGVYISTVELGKFPSKFNNFSQGMDINKAAGIVVSLLDNPVNQITVAK
jgi:short-subunit dehydrogenase